MRLTPLLRAARTPQREDKVPFQAILPLALKTKVSGKGERTSNVSCLQEMAVLFACLKEHEFSEKLCSNEIEKFKSCYNASLETKYLKKQVEARGGIGDTAATATSLTVNRVMRKFPPK